MALQTNILDIRIKIGTSHTSLLSNLFARIPISQFMEYLDFPLIIMPVVIQLLPIRFYFSYYTRSNVTGPLKPYTSHYSDIYAIPKFITFGIEQQLAIYATGNASRHLYLLELS